MFWLLSRRKAEDDAQGPAERPSTPSGAALPFLSVDGLMKIYPNPKGEPFRAVDAASFTVPEPGALVALIGPDGAGKTTLLRLLAGLLRPDAGRARLLGLAPDPENADFTRLIGFMPQKFGLYERLSVAENFELFAKLRGVGGTEARARFADLMTLTGLAGFERRQAGHLSGGMKQKLGLACALAAEPRLLILDEPTVGVDPLSRRELFRIIRRMKDAGVTTILSTAYLDEAARADRVLVLEHGRLIADETPEAWTAQVAGRTFRMSAAGTSASATSAGRSHTAHMPPVRAVDPTSPFLDACPRGDGLDLLMAENAGAAPETIAPAMLASSLSVYPGFTLTARAPTLEDAYAVATLETTPQSGSVALHAAPSGASGAAPGTTSSAATTSSTAAASPATAASSTSSDDADVVVARGISKTFGDFVAVADTTFSVRRGEIFGLLGPNGAGKTTTFRMLCGLLAPTRGSVTVAGVDLRTSKASARARVGYVAQKFSLYERLTVRETLRYFGESYGLFGTMLRTRIEELLTGPLGPYVDWRTDVLPLGAKRELAMASALIHRPAVLFADEATSGADLASRRAFWRRIRALADQGTTTVVTTHFMEEAEYCDRFLIQDAGRVLVIGTPAEVRRSVAAATVEEAFIRIIERNRRC